MIHPFIEFIRPFIHSCLYVYVSSAVPRALLCPRPHQADHHVRQTTTTPLCWMCLHVLGRGNVVSIWV